MTIVEPYTRTPPPPQVALVDENGETDSDHLDPGATRLFGQQDTLTLLLRARKGEGLAYNSEIIRWRALACPDEETWVTRGTDVYALRIPNVVPRERFAEALPGWRDWLAEFAAAPTGTTGSAAWSLLRATLEAPLHLSAGEKPPLSCTRGGRVELGPAGQGDYRGRLELWDLPAAYAHELGHLRYGGTWTCEDLPGEARLERLAERGVPIFVRARVRVPRGLAYGPLHRWMPGRHHHFEANVWSKLRYPDGSPWLYPVGRSFEGIWTWDEVRNAREHGAVVVLEQAWLHLGGRQALLPWWRAVENGRARRGLVSTLAKMTGNALWGRFCMDSRVGLRELLRSSGEKVILRSNRSWPAHDLAETVSGRVRARLCAAMLLAGDDLLSAHTDGLWLRRRPQSGWPGELARLGWRRKEEASRLQLLEPAVLRYTTERDVRTVFAGAPQLDAEWRFDKAWDEYLRRVA